MIIAALLLAQAAPPYTGAPEQLALFRPICMEGSARLGKAEVVSTTASALPAGAKDAFGRASSKVRDAVNPYREADKVGGTLYRLNGKFEAYLITPSVAQSDRSSRVCAIALRGKRYWDAKGLLLNRKPFSLPGEMPFFSMAVGGHNLVALEWGGWTVISATPIGDN